MARRGFNPEGGLWKPLGYLGDFVMLSLLWAACCIPVLTIGPATTAAYDAAVHALRRGDDTLLGRFFSTFKRELGSGILSTLLWLVIGAALFGIYRLLMAQLPEGQTRSIVLIFYLVLVPFFFLCVLGWVFPTLSRFTFTTGALNRTAARLAFGYILRSAALAVLIGGTAYLSFRFGLPIMVLPGAVSYLSTYLIEPVFAHYDGSGEAENVLPG